MCLCGSEDKRRLFLYTRGSQNFPLTYNSMKFNNFYVPTIFFLCIYVKQLKLERLADSGGDIYKVASNAAYY
jgi:hypothetical protein